MSVRLRRSGMLITQVRLGILFYYYYCYYYYYYVIWTVQLKNENVWLRMQCEALLADVQQLTEERDQLRKQRDELRASLQHKRLTYL